MVLVKWVVTKGIKHLQKKPIELGISQLVISNEKFQNFYNKIVF